MNIAFAYGLNLVDSGSHGGWSGPLAGCCNDAGALTAIAVQRGAERVVPRLNSYAGVFSAVGAVIPPYRLVLDATAANFRADHEEAFKIAKPGDLFTFSFSGHGARAKYLMDTVESFVFAERLLSDNEFYNLMLRWPEGVRVHYVFDCCHAAGLLRNAAFGRVRTAGELAVDSIRPVAREKGTPKANIALFTAAQADQYALDGAHNGAFTAALLYALEKNPKASLPEVFEIVKRQMRVDFLNQTPGLHFYGDPSVWHSRPAWT